MDIKTLIIAALFTSLTINLSMAIVYWTRRTYPGFGYWLAGTGCRTLAAILFLLPRDQFPPWLTIVVANFMMIGEFLLYLRGIQVFRGQSVGYARDAAISVSFIALLTWFTYLTPNFDGRLISIFLYRAMLEAWMLGGLLTRRPPYFGSIERWQAGILAILATIDLCCAAYIAARTPAPLATDFLATPLFLGYWVLFITMNMLLIVVSFIIMNAQRLEYDYRLARQHLEEDIEQRQRIEAALRDSEEQFRLAFSNANTGMLLVDLDGKLMRVNDKTSEIFGYSRAALETMTVDDLALPEDRGLSRRYMQQAAGGALDSLTFEKRYRHREGHVIYGLIASSLVRDGNGQPRYFISQVQDITQRKEAEEKLRISEERHRLLAENAMDVIWTMTLDGGISYVSPAVEKLRGYTPAEAMRQPLDDILTPDSQAVVIDYFQRLQTAVQEGRPPERFRGELEYRCRDGSTVWTEVIALPMTGADGTFIEILGMTRDISERKRHEHELQQARDAAERASRAKGEFLAHMSHEIRTPMNAVLGLAQVLNREPLSADQRDMVGRIQAAGQSLLAILNDILDFSKIEAGGLRLEFRPFDLGALLIRVTDLMEQSARAKGLCLSLIQPPAALGPLLGDRLRLEQVLLNLVGNAVKFTEQGEVAVSIEVQESNDTTRRLRFAVRDSGIGIAPETLQRLFTPFTQADAGISRRFGGSGLGLAICKRLVESMGGTIGAESREGQGSTFWFELPFTRADGAEVEAPASPPPAPSGGPRLVGARVLVVDDSAMNRDLLQRALGLEGAAATLAADGEQALRVLKSHPAAFDAVLMDLQMPVLDGLTATRLMRREPGLRSLPVIAFTAAVLPEQRAAAREAGCDDVVAKPVDLEQLTAVLLNWIPVPRPGATMAGQAAETAGADAEDADAIQPLDPPPAGAAASPVEVPAIPGIDRDRVTVALAGNARLFLQLLAGFLAEFADVAAQTRQDLEQGERESALRRMHTLGGNAGTLGALDLERTARRLEGTIKDSARDAEPGLEDLGRQLEALRTASAPWLTAAAPSTSAPAPAAPRPGGEQLEGLREDLRNHDLDALRRFEALQPGLPGVLGESRTAALAAAIQSLRFAEALRLLDGGE